MIAGTLGLLESPATDKLDSYGSGGFATLDVRDTHEYLDGASVQTGAACATVEGTQEEVHVSGTSIDVEEVGVRSRVWTDWVADVADAGFVVAERTAGSTPVFPFDLFSARTGVEVRPARIDPGAFIRDQERTGDLHKVWYAGAKEVTDSDLEPDNVQMGYGADALASVARDANIGVGFKTTWNGTVAKGILYASGYVACYNDSWGPVQFARFIREELLPHAAVPDEEDAAEQSTLDGGAEA